MDWAKAIATHQAALARIVAALIAMVGLASGGTMARLPKPLYRAVLRVLGPAEAALCRLIVMAARGLKVNLPPSRPMPKGLTFAGNGEGRPSFPLFDPPQRASRMYWKSKKPIVKAEPRIHFFDGDSLVSLSLLQPTKQAEPDDGKVRAERLLGRLAAIKRALETLPAQAKRLARWKARQARLHPAKSKSPLRQGSPPGHRSKPIEEIDWVLRNCHALATTALKHDTS